MVGRCDHFECIDDALCDRVRTMVVALMLINESSGNEIGKLQKVGQERKAEKESVRAEGKEQEAKIAGEWLSNKGKTDNVVDYCVAHCCCIQQAWGNQIQKKNNWIGGTFSCNMYVMLRLKYVYGLFSFGCCMCILNAKIVLPSLKEMRTWNWMKFVVVFNVSC